MTTAQQLREYLLKMRYTQQELADCAGIALPTLASMLRGNTPRIDTLARIAACIADILGTSRRQVFLNLALGAGNVYELLGLAQRKESTTGQA